MTGLELRIPHFPALIESKFWMDDFPFYSLSYSHNVTKQRYSLIPLINKQIKSSCILPVQTIPARISHSRSTVSDHEHFIQIPFLKRKFYSVNFPPNTACLMILRAVQFQPTSTCKGDFLVLYWVKLF